MNRGSSRRLIDLPIRRSMLAVAMGLPSLLPGHLLGRPLDRFHDVVVAGAPAEVAFELVADLLLGRLWIALQQTSRLHFVAVRLAGDRHLHWEFHASSSTAWRLDCAAPCGERA